MSTSQKDKAEAFQALHRRAGAFVVRRAGGRERGVRAEG